MKGPSPAFSFYPKDWLADGPVRELNHEQKGIYADLLAIYWLEGELPSDVVRLARLAGVPRKRFERLWPGIDRCFRVEGSRLYQKRLEEEMVKQIAFRESQSKKGRKGGKSRHINKGKKPRLNPGLTQLKPEDSLPSPSSFPSSIPSSHGNDRKEESSAPRAANPLVDRDALVSEGHALIREIAPKAHLDPTEVMQKASAWKGRSYMRLDAMPDDRLAHAVAALRSWARELRGEPEPQLPERSPPPMRAAQARQDSMAAFLRGGLEGHADANVADGTEGSDPGLPRSGPDRGGAGGERPALPAAPRRPDR